MPISSRIYFPALDGLRGIAILLVFLSHNTVWGFEEAGGTGVAIFFALSGFLITNILIQEIAVSGTINITSFYRKRILRLLPALLLCVSLFLFLGLVSSEQSLAILLYYGNFRRIQGDGLGFLNHTWSLSIEEQFYILWPFIMLYYGKGKRFFLPIASGVFIFGTLLRTWLWLDTRSILRVHFGTESNFPSILIGCIAAFFLASYDSPRKFSAYLYYSCISFICLLSGMFRYLGISNWIIYTDDFTFTLSWPLTSLIASLLILQLAISKEKKSFLELTPLRHLGKISYGFYLFHFPIIRLLRWYEIPYVTICSFIITYTLSLVSYNFFEKNFLKQKIHID